MKGNIDIFTDGSYSPQTSKGGFAFKVIGSDEVFMSWGSVLRSDCTDIMSIEAIAISKAIDAITRNCVMTEIADITVYTDNKSISDFLTDGTLPDAADHIKENLTDLSKKFNCLPGKCLHVKAHTSSNDFRSKQNEWCDTYANAARLTGGQFFFKQRLIRGTRENPIMAVSIGYVYDKYNYAIELRNIDKTIRATGFFKPEAVENPVDAFYAAVLNASAMSKRVKIPFKDVLLCLVGDTIELAYYISGQEDNKSPYKKRFEAITKGKAIYCYPKDESCNLSFDVTDMSYVANAVKSMQDGKEAAITIKYNCPKELI